MGPGQCGTISTRQECLNHVFTLFGLGWVVPDSVVQSEQANVFESGIYPIRTWVTGPRQCGTNQTLGFGYFGRSGLDERPQTVWCNSEEANTRIRVF